MNSAYETLGGPPFHPKKPYKTYLYAGGTIAIIPRRARLLYYYTCRLPFLARTILAGSVCAHTRHACKLKRTVEHGYTSDFLQLFVNSKSFVLENFWEAKLRGDGFCFPTLFSSICSALFLFLFDIYIYFLDIFQTSLWAILLELVFCLFDQVSGSLRDVSPALYWMNYGKFWAKYSLLFSCSVQFRWLKYYL